MTRLLLVGAGHAHLHLLARSGQLAGAGYVVELVSPETFSYSGMASATAVGALPREAGVVDVAALAAAASIRHHRGTLVDLDLPAGVAATSGGARVSFDVISFNIGSVVDPPDMLLDASVIKVKPLTGLDALDARLTSLTDGASVTVVGAGASGIELAAQIGLRPEVEHLRLLEKGPLVAPDLSRGARRSVVRLLARRGIELRLGARVERIEKERVVLADETSERHDLVVLASGLSAPPLVSALGIGDRDGIPVLATLVHPEHPHLYAVGDCARFLPRRLPRIGVHGVRQGPVLLESLLARAAGRALPQYRPPRRVLGILDLGDQVGLSVWGPFWWRGRSSWALKRWIDRRWLARYRASS